MIIILEGVDKCGKTTIANKLRDEHGFTIVKCSQPKGDPYVEYYDKLLKAKGNVVFDRFLYGELVYGPLYRGKSKLTPWQVRNLELKLISLGAVMIYCLDTVENICERFKTEKETFAKAELVPKMLKLYDKVMMAARIPIHFHVMKSGSQDITKGNTLAKLIEAGTGESVKKMKTVVGNISHPKLILVGEKRNENQLKRYPVRVHQPFDFGPASDFLFKELEYLKIKLSDVMLLNSDSPELKKNLKNIEAPIIALGKRASSKLDALKIKHIATYHPQYVKRFGVGKSAFRRILSQTYGKTNA